MATVSVSLLRFITEKVRPPRALLVPFRHGYPLGEPNDAEAQTRVVEAMLRLLESAKGPPPVLADLAESPPG